MDPPVEEGFANFLQNEQNHVIESNAGLEFDLTRDNLHKPLGYQGDTFLSFVGEDIFEHPGWSKSKAFWRFRSYLFLTKYKNVGKMTPNFCTLLTLSYPRKS